MILLLMVLLPLMSASLLAPPPPLHPKVEVLVSSHRAAHTQSQFQINRFLVLLHMATSLEQSLFIAISNTA